MAAFFLPFLAVCTVGQSMTTTPDSRPGKFISYKTCSSNECSHDTFDCSASTCSLACTGYNSCSGVNIMAEMTDSLTINCEYDDACDNMIIHAENAGTVTFTSNNYKSDSVTIYANSSSSLNLNCKGKYACKNFYVVSGENYGNIYLDASYNYAFDDSTLNVSEASSVSISCSSESYDYACNSNEYYLPNYGLNTEINCYGGGCKFFGDIYVQNSVQSLNVNINGCNDECSSTSDCISSWTIHCANTPSSLDYHDTDRFYGEYCTLSSTNDCDCDQMVNSVQFSNYDDDQCVSDNSDTTSSSIAAVIGSMVGIFICVAIVLIIVCVIKAQKRSRYNYTAPATGIQPAKHVPVQGPVQVQPQPIVQQQPVPVQQPQVVYMQQMPQQQHVGQNMQPRIVYVQAPPQNVNAVAPIQPQPTQQYSANNNVSVAPGYNPSAPSAPSAPEHDAPPAYNNEAPGGGEGAVTNY